MSEKSPCILIAGGAGYIGSHAVLDLKSSGYQPVIVDNFSRGNKDIAELTGAECEEGELSDCAFLKKVIKKYNPDAVMHFAAWTYVGESVSQPERYYNNNVVATLNLLSTMRELGVGKFIFSSTAATYGLPEAIPIPEDAVQAPINPYGSSKLMVERILSDFNAAYGLQYTIFRYFNAAGASSNALIGERHDPETHLIPLALSAAAKGTPFKVFGTDYPTQDGTCIRDYVHVDDIARAHVLGLQRLEAGEEKGIYNIGTGSGYSVLEVINTIEKVTGLKVPYEVADRRAGDPPELIAKAERISKDLKWHARHSGLEEIISTAWAWHRKDWDLT